MLPKNGARVRIRCIHLDGPMGGEPSAYTFVCTATVGIWTDQPATDIDLEFTVPDEPHGVQATVICMHSDVDSGPVFFVLFLFLFAVYRLISLSLTGLVYQHWYSDPDATSSRPGSLSIHYNHEPSTDQSDP